ncbi:MAG: hypothetical protein UX57_C0010G0020 [Candidatus Uhrbacteria bacterium GW2011_GWE2_46_68]|uniref:DUF6938 domain-containing protein n=2 Tax=Candidatus Uhriibacteriota TaxID=1752732 RepID=A0A0G1Q6V1_9BACT|nr:MAG: hypothetical protein UX45_C0012G0020 [Candidatus Uhrbacteria bacterium GW2011_GWF2_46_218]KKU40776.1 MAG: hypothetical protein UX57_C0010G0020 [Candidatus Uhrbacteria bacterium GW2011_GWE2_46_68]
MAVKKTTRQAWVVDVDMGYGHSRAAHALRDLGGGEVISANNYEGIPDEDKERWRKSREAYEKISRLKPLPVVGDMLFGAMDRLQQIPSFYPRRDLSRPNIQLREMYHLIKKGMGKHLIEKISENPVPLVTTFFLPAFAADYFDYPGKIYCITTDADVSRSWAPLDPKRSRIIYFASNGRVAERLKLYGVRSEQIHLTGFPLPKELIGGPRAGALKERMRERLCHLDPQGIFTDRYLKTLQAELGKSFCITQDGHRPLTLLYSVGGAGAQRKIAVDILNSLKGELKQGKLRLILMAGTRKDVARFFQDAVLDLGLKQELGQSILIPSYSSRKEYFDGFTDWLKETDILWTKPSELSFYTGLGIPIIIAPPIGSQEVFNQVWLQYVGGGIPQADPRYTNEWLFDWIQSGGVARMAWSGFVEAPTHGTYRIENIVLGKPDVIHPLPLIV